MLYSCNHMATVGVKGLRCIVAVLFPKPTESTRHSASCDLNICPPFSMYVINDVTLYVSVSSLQQPQLLYAVRSLQSQRLVSIDY